ncbi:MAG: enoyl-CoA hydratase, partial [Actinomycetota bacterium]|nr:enoyl-CoA hydratase [Actinomycetota bacterium]
DLILTGRIIDADEAHAIGLVTELVAQGTEVGRALAMAEGLASVPQATMLADRRAAIEAFGLPLTAGLAVEAQAGPAVFGDAIDGAARFAGGEGRGGRGAGV